MRYNTFALCVASCLLAGPAVAHTEGKSALDLLIEGPPPPMMSYVLIGRATGIEPTDIAAIEISDSGDITDVFVRLAPEATMEFTEWTTLGVGFEMRVSICGMNVLQAVVQAPINTGTLYILDLNAIQAEAMRALWSGRETCATLDPEVFPLGP